MNPRHTTLNHIDWETINPQKPCKKNVLLQLLTLVIVILEVVVEIIEDSDPSIFL